MWIYTPKETKKQCFDKTRGSFVSIEPEWSWTIFISDNEFFKIASNCNPKKDDNNKVIKKVADIVNIKEAISNIKDDD